MSTLTSSSTPAQIQAAYADNASYAEDNSAAKAKAFITACRMLLGLTPSSTSTAGVSVDINLEVVERQQKSAETWLATHAVADSGSIGRVRHLAFSEDFRG